MSAPRKTCKHCERRRPETDTFIAGRHGGGNYRRAGRMYRSTICLDCAAVVCWVARDDASGTTMRWDTFALMRHLGDRLGIDTRNLTPRQVARRYLTDAKRWPDRLVNAPGVIIHHPDPDRAPIMYDDPGQALTWLADGTITLDNLEPASDAQARARQRAMPFDTTWYDA